jgi:hypothetical protein
MSGFGDELTRLMTARGLGVREELDDALDAGGHLAALVPVAYYRRSVPDDRLTATDATSPSPPALTAPPAASWAIPIYEAALSPLDAPRQSVATPGEREKTRPSACASFVWR